MIAHLPFHLKSDSSLLTIFLMDLEASYLAWLGSVLKVHEGINHKENDALVIGKEGPLDCGFRQYHKFDLG